MKVKRILIIDASDINNLFLGLAENNFLVSSKNIETKNKHSEKLVPAIAMVLKNSKLKLEDLSAIGVVTGPGSYTSLKIGLTVANTLAWGLNIPVVGFKLETFKDKNELVKKIYQKIKLKNKFEKIVEPFYESAPYYEK
ncbi:MAG: tRNA (adenosine(37)-N6)-threonylcarbamoyltransferase complex dimerization subunit type 1 TsaB [Patescibacteria group bacterium]